MVDPELPVLPLQVFQLVPLCWFLVPIFCATENNKHSFPLQFPDNVVFIHQPDLCFWTDLEIGSMRENRDKEQLLIRVTDNARCAREQIEQLMKKFNDTKEEESQNKKYYPTLTIDESEKNVYNIDGYNWHTPVLRGTESGLG